MDTITSFHYVTFYNKRLLKSFFLCQLSIAVVLKFQFWATHKTKQKIQNLATHIIQKHYFYTGFGEPKVIVSDPPVENHCSKKYNLVPYLSFQLVLVPSYCFDLSELFVDLINIRSSQHLIGELVSWKANDQFAAFN